MEKQSGIRLNKYIAECGICSRRDADTLISEGKVKVNGMIPEAGTRVFDKDIVTVNDKKITPVKKKHVYAYYKPVGVVCTEKDEHAEKTISTEVKTPVRVTYAGRLDQNSCGLLILSNDGDLIQKMMKSKNGHEKEYVVKVDKDITGSFLRQMASGVFLEELGQTTKPCKVTKSGKNQFQIVLTQGLNRQIRRMCKTLGYNVRSLKRISVMNIVIADLKPGEVREIVGVDKVRLYEKCGLKCDLDDEQFSCNERNTDSFGSNTRNEKRNEPKKYVARPKGKRRNTSKGRR